MSRTRPIDARGVARRAEQAREFLSLAERAALDPTEARTNAAGSLAVLAAIAAGDAICGKLLGERSVGENHAEAVRLLERATGRSAAVTQFRRLLSAKSDTQYGTDLVSETRMRELLVSAQRIVSEMEDVLRA